MATKPMRPLATLITLAVIIALIVIVATNHHGTAASTATTTSTEFITTTTISPYPPHEQGDKDFALQSIRAVTQEFTGTFGGTIRVTNVGTQPYSATFTLTFFATSDFTQTPIGSAIANVIGVQPGQTATADLTSTDTAPSGKFYYQFQTSAEFPS